MGLTVASQAFARNSAHPKRGVNGGEVEAEGVKRPPPLRFSRRNPACGETQASWLNPSIAFLPARCCGEGCVAMGDGHQASLPLMLL